MSAPHVALTHIHVRWNLAVDAGLHFLGDHWERSYGDLAWRTMTPERVMPWYFAGYDGTALHGYGVETGAASMCFWQVDPEGVSLWLDVSNGGSGVELGERQLHAATVVARRGEAGEDPLAAVRKFCEVMCAKPRPVPNVIYGTNDWYYAYGNSSREQILEDAELAALLCPRGGPRPYPVIDDRWTNKTKFPDMQRLSGEIRERGARPGIWIRPLIAPPGTNAALLTPDARFGSRKERMAELAYDPTIPDALEAVRAKLRELKGWGYELVKRLLHHDLLGQWGFEMGARPALPEWPFHDRTRTNAEIISDLYKEIRSPRRDDADPRLQHGGSSGRRCFRSFKNRRRHERENMGAHAAHGRQHHQFPPTAASQLFRRRWRLRRRDESSWVARDCRWLRVSLR